MRCSPRSVPLALLLIGSSAFAIGCQPTVAASLRRPATALEVRTEPRTESVYRPTLASTPAEAEPENVTEPPSAPTGTPPTGRHPETTTPRPTSAPAPSPAHGSGGTASFPGVLVSADGSLPRWDPSAARPDSVGAPGSPSGACPQPPLFVTAGQLVSGVSCSVPAVVQDAADVEIAGSALDAGVTVHDLTRPARAVVRQSTVGGSNAVSGSAAIVEHSLLTSTNDGVTLTGGAHGLPSLVENNWIERDGSRVGNNHHDGIQLWQGGNLTIRRNWISGFQVSAILIKSDLEQVPGDGPIRNVLVEENYLANPTGYYTMYVVDGGKGRPQFVTVRNNVFGKGAPISTGASAAGQAVFVRSDAERDAAVADGVAGAAEWVAWTNNVSAATGAEIVPPGGWYRYTG